MQNREYTKKHWILHFKQVKCLICESYLNKAVTYIFKSLFVNLENTKLNKASYKST